MTEKTLLVENPFKFESDQKRFIQQLEQIQEDELPQDDLGDIPIGPKERLQKQSKKYGIIRALDEEAEKIAKAREEVLLKNIQNERSKTTKHKGSKSMKLWDVSDYEPKKGLYKVKSLLKEKKETIGEFVKKKREIFLSNINIKNKEEETQRLEDFIKNEQESLKARDQYFVKDSELVKKFMEDVKKAADKATKGAEVAAKSKETLKSKFSRLQVQIDNSKNRNDRLREDIKFLQSYKTFIEKARKQMKVIDEKKQKEQAKKMQQQKVPLVSQQVSKQSIARESMSQQPQGFITEPQPSQQQFSNEQSSQNLEDESQQPSKRTSIDQQNIIKGIRQSQQQTFSEFQEEVNPKYPGIDFDPSDLVQYLDSIEEKNLTLIHVTFEHEDDLTVQETEQKELKYQLDQRNYENQKKLNQIKKQIALAEKRKSQLEEKININTDKVQLTEGQALRFEEIQEKIEYIHNLVLKDSKEKFSMIKQETKDKDKEKQEKTDFREVNSMIMKQKMKDIEQKMYELTLITTEQEKKNKQLFQKCKTEVVHQKHQQEKKYHQLEKEKLSLKQSNKDKPANSIRQGRKIMSKSIIQKKEVKKEVEVQENTDDDEKYLQENYSMCQDFKQKN